MNFIVYYQFQNWRKKFFKGIVLCVYCPNAPDLIWITTQRQLCSFLFKMNATTPPCFYVLLSMCHYLGAFESEIPRALALFVARALIPLLLSYYSDVEISTAQTKLMPQYLNRRTITYNHEIFISSIFCDIYYKFKDIRSILWLCLLVSVPKISYLALNEGFFMS